MNVVPVVMNAAAGSAGAGAREEVEAALRDSGLTSEVHAVEAHELAEHLRSLAAEQEVIAVAGGDGTMRTAVGALAGGSTALAPIPLGTLNHFARRLGVESIEIAASSIAAGATASVPVGIVDDTVFLNTATFGLYADVVRRRERWRRYLTKWPAAVMALITSLRHLQPVQVFLEVDGRTLERRTPLVWVGLGWGSFPRVTESPERRDSPDLEVAVLRPRSAAGLIRFTLRVASRVMRGQQPIHDHALEVIHTRAFLIRANATLEVTLDGETVRLRPPVFVAVQDDALRVIAPERLQDEGGEERG